MSERLNWMLVPQGVLFGALAWIMKLLNEEPITQIQIEKLEALAAMVSTLGATLALIGFVGSVAAGRMHFLWTNQINKIAKALNENGSTNPLVSFGMKPHWPARTSTVMPTFVTVAFFFAWAIFINQNFKDGMMDIIYIILILETLFAGAIVGFVVCMGGEDLSKN